MVTGSITIADMDPRQFCQTFFLARQHQDNDRHNYFVRNDIFRFLDVLPEVVQVRLRDCYTEWLLSTRRCRRSMSSECLPLLRMSP